MTEKKEVIVSEKVGKYDLSLETGKLAKQAHGSVFARYGNIAVLAAVVRTEARADIGFFPLTVEYRENKFAAGKIPGGYFKREAQPRRKETITCRLIDRPIRPMFPDGFKDEVQISVFVYSADEDNDPDVIGINAASAALVLSDIPFYGPIGAVRVGLVKGNFIVNPTEQEREQSDIDLIVAGTDESIVMVEASTKEVSEEVIIDALKFAHEQIKPLVKLQLDLADQAGIPKRIFESVDTSEIKQKIDGIIAVLLEEAYSTLQKDKRKEKLDEAKSMMLEALLPEADSKSEKEKKAFEATLNQLFDTLRAEKMRNMIKNGKRIDGRSFKDIRQISGEVGLLPGAHGSAVFTRGETQALVSVTLGSLEDRQKIKGLHPEKEEDFYLHYDFMPFSVGEVKFYRSKSRREIGHGLLAQKALEPVVPDEEDFPYTMRIVSHILESNGSSSMASVCAATLAMMDCGVRIKRPVAGIAMGLLKEEDEYFILSDILGEEDHYGDMDFKVAGSQRGITALQMDIKITGIKSSIIAESLEQAREGRIFILREMLKIIDKPKEDYGDNVPKIEKVKIDPQKIGAVIGSQGKVIKSIEEETGTDLEISDEGIVFIMGRDKSGIEAAKERVELIVHGPKVGTVYNGTVRSIKNFGAFVEIVPGIDGLVHVSDLDTSYVENVGDVVQVGDSVKVKVLDVDRDGKIRLSRKALL